MSDPTLADVHHLFHTFVANLLTGQYADARELLSEEAAGVWSSAALAQAWTAMLVDDSPVSLLPETIAVDAMDTWEERQASDVGWGYVPVVNATANEAVSGIAMLTPRGLKIRTLEFGRP